VPPEEDRATATGSAYKTFGEVWPRGFRAIRANILIALLRSAPGGEVIIHVCPTLRL